MRTPSRLFCLLALLCGCIALSTVTACNSNKTGCPSTEQATKGTTNKKGELNTKRGRSNLFPKGMR